MKNIKSILSGLFCLFCLINVKAQENTNTLLVPQKNSIDVTLGGIGLGGSVNYSRIVMVNENHFINASVGAGAVPSVGFSFPHQLTVNFGKKSSFLEAGVGGVFSTDKDTSTPNLENETSYHIAPIVGWRKYLNDKWVLRLYASPLINLSGDIFIGSNEVIPYGGVSLGYSF